MTDLVVDGSLCFHFGEEWLASRSEDAYTKQPGHKDADLVAASNVAVLIEVKDDRTDTRRVRGTEFLPEMALKFRHTIEDLHADTAPLHPALHGRFTSAWGEQRRRLILWWEHRPNLPPAATRELRWKAYLQTMQATLRQEVRDLKANVLIGNSDTHPNGPMKGIVVTDVPGGVAVRHGR